MFKSGDALSKLMPKGDECGDVEKALRGGSDVGDKDRALSHADFLAALCALNSRFVLNGEALKGDLPMPGDRARDGDEPVELANDDKEDAEGDVDKMRVSP